MKKIIIGTYLIIMFVLFSSFLNFFFGSSMSPKRKMASKITSELSGMFKKKYDLNFMGISEEAAKGKYKCIGLKLTYDKVISKDEGRVLLINCIQYVLDSFNSHPKFRQYMANVPFTGENIGVTIFIQPPKSWDVCYPDIGTFSFFNDTLWYITYDPGKSYPYHSEEEESFEEAKKIVALQQANEHYDLE
jgi:hypothetical protein